MGLNLNVSVQTDWNVGVTQGAQGTGGIQGPRGDVFGDNQVSLAGLNITFNYTNDSGTPALPTPNPNASDQVPQQYTRSGQETESLKQEQTGAETFAQLLEDSNLTHEQASTVVFHAMAGTVPDDTFLSNALNEIDSKVAEEMLETYGDDIPSLKEQADAVKSGGKATVNSAREQLQQLLDSLPPDHPDRAQIEKFIQEAEGNLDDIQDTFDQLENATDRGELEKLLGDLDDQLGDLQDKLGDAHTLTNDPNVGSVLSTVLTSIRTGAEIFSDQIARADKNSQIAQGNWSMINGEMGKAFMKTLDTEFAAKFDQALEQYAEKNGLTEEQTAQLKFARSIFGKEEFAELFDSLPENIKQMLSEVHTQAADMMSSNWGMPDGFFPTGSSNYVSDVEFANGEAFETLLGGTDLQAMAQQLGVSEANLKGMLEYLFNNPELVSEEVLSNPEETNKLLKLLGVKKSNLSAILNKLAEFKDGAAEQIASKFGLPPGFKPNPNTVNYNTRNEGEFLRQFDYDMKNQQPPLTNDQIAEVLHALSNPLDPSIKSETKALIQKIYNQAVGEIRSTYNLPVGWGPPITQLSSLANITPSTRMAWSTISQTEEQLQIMATFVDAMPDNPSKALMINVMKIVSEAITQLKVSIAQIQIMDTELATKISGARKDAALYKVDLQKKKLEEAKKKKAKAAKFGLIMKILGPIFAVLIAFLMVASGGVLGGVFAAFLVPAMTLEAAGVKGIEKFNPIGRMFEAIMEDLPSPANIIVASILCTGMAAAGGWAVGFVVFFEHSDIIPALVEATGGTKSEGEMANKITKLAVEIIIAIIVIIATWGAAAPAIMGGIGARFGTLAGKAATQVAKALAKIASTLERLGKPGRELAKIFRGLHKELMGPLKTVNRTKWNGKPRLYKKGHELAGQQKTKEVGGWVTKLTKLQNEVRVGKIAVKNLEKMKKNLGTSEGPQATFKQLNPGLTKKQLKTKFLEDLKNLNPELAGKKFSDLTKYQQKQLKSQLADADSTKAFSSKVFDKVPLTQGQRDVEKALLEASEKLSIAKEALYKHSDYILWFSKNLNVITSAMTFSTAVVQARTSFIQADLARMMARFDAEIEQLENLIKIFQKILSKIFEGLASQGEWMAELGNLQTTMWRDLSQTASKVAGA